MSCAIQIRDLDDSERAWANEHYRSIAFSTTPAGSVALVAELAGARVGLGRLVRLAPGVLELGGIWTDASARGRGIARAMVTALLERAARGGEAAPLWCIPFTHLAAFYESFGFAPRPAPWPEAIAAKVCACGALGQDVVVQAR